ncbi:MAG: recombination regulator RecX [Clostridiales bacterium]|jgi:regulatory protein|nr:recombination regulator RecX [Clostridiales bacterium]
MMITALEPQRRKPKRWSVFLDGEFAFGIDEVDMLYYKLAVNSEITKERLDFLKESLLAAKARDRALAFLGHKARTRGEVESKLKEDGYPEDLIARTLELLTGYGYVDDLGYAREYIEQRSNAGYGFQQIRWNLEQKGIDAAVLEEAFEHSVAREEEAVLKALLSKTRGEVLTAPAKKMKLYEFLLRRGFPSELARAAMKKTGEDLGEDWPETE